MNRSRLYDEAQPPTEDVLNEYAQRVAGVDFAQITDPDKRLALMQLAQQGELVVALMEVSVWFQKSKLFDGA